MTVTALIVAAGKGERLGGDVPKQYRAIAGKPVLRWAVEAMGVHPSIDQVRVVIGEGRQDSRSVHCRTCTFGALRSRVVRSGPTACSTGCGRSARARCWFTTQPAPFARPTSSTGFLLRSTGTMEPSRFFSVADTLAKGSDGVLDAPVDRKSLLRVQTPQAFHVEDLIYAYDEAGRTSATDESTVMLAPD